MKKLAAISFMTMFLASLLIASPAAAVSPPDCVSVIVVFKEAVSAQDVSYITSLGGAIKYTYTIIDGVAAVLPRAAADQLKAMQKDPETARSDPMISRIKYIQDDLKMYAMGTGSEGAAGGASVMSVAK